MSDPELALILDAALAEITRPHLSGEPVTHIVRDALRRLGLVCDESTPREKLIVKIWAMKRQAGAGDAARKLLLR